MKKIVLAVVALMLATPAMAAVNFTGTEDGSISYDASGEGQLVRAFGLDISVDAGVITGVSVEGAEPYWVYPGTIDILNGEVNDVGSPVAPKSDPGACGELGESCITIEMGSLYEEGDAPNTPALSGLLIQVEVSEDCNVCVNENPTRGGVVLEDASGAATNLELCFKVTTGPSCWCEGQLCGDSDCSGSVNFADLVALRKSWLKTDPDPAYDPCADFDRSGSVNFADLVVLRKNWLQSVPPCK